MITGWVSVRMTIMWLWGITDMLRPFMQPEMQKTPLKILRLTIL